MSSLPIEFNFHLLFREQVFARPFGKCWLSLPSCFWVSPPPFPQQALGVSMVASVVSHHLCGQSNLQPSWPFSEARGLPSLPDKELSVNSWISSRVIKLSVCIQDPSPLSVSGGWPFCAFIVRGESSQGHPSDYLLAALVKIWSQKMFRLLNY